MDRLDELAIRPPIRWLCRKGSNLRSSHGLTQDLEHPAYRTQARNPNFFQGANQHRESANRFARAAEAPPSANSLTSGFRWGLGVCRPSSNPVGCYLRITQDRKFNAESRGVFHGLSGQCQRLTLRPRKLYMEEFRKKPLGCQRGCGGITTRSHMVFNLTCRRKTTRMVEGRAWLGKP